MKVFRTVAEVREWRNGFKTVGYLPTMGALHKGHLSMVRKSILNNDATIVSIFVNPSQFSPTEDLDQYPRNLEGDVAKILECAKETNPEISEDSLAVFAPTVAEMYPSGIDLDISKQKGTFVDVLGCSNFLEGAIRPHFFRGVATVVTKLLNAVQANVAYFGQKDVQQTVVVRRLVKDLLIPTSIEISPIVREASGLAMSSRNEYLSADVRERAAVLYKGLQLAQKAFTAGDKSQKSLQEIVRNEINTESTIVDEIEYVSLNEPSFFQPKSEAAEKGDILSVAVRLVGGVRILDNIILE